MLVSATNDNSAPPPSPLEFARLLAEFLNARDHALETKAIDDHRVAEALRMQLVEAYEHAYRGGRLTSI